MSNSRRRAIDRRYLFGDTLIKTGVAAVVFLLLVALLTPFGLRDAVSAGVQGYAVLLGAMALLAALLLLFGYRLRARATQLDRDRD